MQIGPVLILDGGSPRIDLILGRFGPHDYHLLGAAANQVFRDLPGRWTPDDDVVNLGVHQGDLFQVVFPGGWLLQVHEGDLVLIVRYQDVRLGDYHVGNLLGNELPNEVLVEVNPIDVPVEGINEDVNEQAIREHKLQNDIVPPLAEDDPPLLQLFLQQFKGIPQPIGLLIIHVPFAAPRLEVVPLALGIDRFSIFRLLLKIPKTECKRRQMSDIMNIVNTWFIVVCFGSL